MNRPSVRIATTSARGVNVSRELFASPTDPNVPNFANFLKQGEGLLQLPHPEENRNYLLTFLYLAHPIELPTMLRMQVPNQKFEFSSSPAQAAQLIHSFRTSINMGGPLTLLSIDVHVVLSSLCSIPQP